MDRSIRIHLTIRSTVVSACWILIQYFDYYRTVTPKGTPTLTKKKMKRDESADKDTSQKYGSFGLLMKSFMKSSDEEMKMNEDEANCVL